MSMFHSTLTRRNFMKMLGLTGLGLGSAAVATPIFHDMDEMISSGPGYSTIHPWWVKEREFKKPTFDIDWKIKERFSQTLHCFDVNAHIRAVGKAEVDRRNKSASDRTNQWVKENRQGFALRDRSLGSAAGFGDTMWGTEGYWVAPKLISRPADYGGAQRWEGTPEENTRMLRAALRVYGGRNLGVIPIDQDTQKLIYWIEVDYKPYVFENVPKGYETGPVYPVQRDQGTHRYDFYDANSPQTHYSNMKYKRVIPNSKQMYIVAWNSQESPEIMKHGDTMFGSTSVTLAYADGREQINRLQQFIEGIGYEALGEPTYNQITPNFASNVFAGVTELSRMGITSVSPEFGSATRCWTLLTDLPLAATNPIDAGIYKFCDTCKICAENCPSGALSLDTERTWDPSAPANSSRGSNVHWWNGPKCYGWWRDGSVACYVCNGVCPFLSEGKAVIHDLVKLTASVTPLVNGFFADMERSFGFTHRKNGYLGTDNLGAGQVLQPSWWDMEIPEKGFDSTKAVKGW